ncbi:MAG: ATP-binding protein [Kosmotogaceae bacterium]
MKIAVLSGKGGTGKTTISTNLAWVLSKEMPIQLMDMDTEEPNSHIFFDVDFTHEESTNLLIPEVNNEKCTRCGKCAEVCQFGAIAVFETGVLVFDGLCHGCGACSIVCPENAITEVPKSIGKIKLGNAEDNLAFGMGLLNIGEMSGVPIIRHLKKHIDDNRTVILDSPPGVSCPVVETLRGADSALLVTEATPLGFHDLLLAVDVVREMGIPMGVVVNRASDDYEQIEKYVEVENIPLLGKIPYDKKIAEKYSRGELFVKEDKDWFEEIRNIFERIKVVTPQ